jgi:hypothetical protein
MAATQPIQKLVVMNVDPRPAVSTLPVFDSAV